MRHRLPSVIALTLVGVFAAGVASAGAQSTDTTPTTAPAATTTSPVATGPPAPRSAANSGVTATSITVGGLGYGSLYGDSDVGAKARFGRANDAGGVNGRTINYVGFTDDNGDPALDTQGAAKLVTLDHVFAVVPTVTPDLAAADYLVQQKVPYFGWALSSDFCGNAYGFGFTGCLVSQGVTSNAWGVLVANAFGPASTGKTAAIVTETTPSGQYQLTSLTAGLTSAKLKVVYGKSTLATPATGDYGAIATQVLTSNGGKPPDAVFVVGNLSNVLGMTQALRAAGFLGLVTNQLQYSPNQVASAAGVFVMVQTAPTESAPTNPAVAQMIADVQKVAPGQPVTPGVAAGYWSADLFLAAVKKAGKKLTAQGLVRAASAKFAYNVASTVGPTRFPAAHSRPTPCGALVASNGTAYVVKVPYMCGAVVPVK